MKEDVFFETITSDDILGKDVIDSDHAFIGVVEKLHLTTGVDVVGITIDRGFLKKGFSVGKSYIKKVTPHAVFLKIKPSFFIKGMPVFDSAGIKIGIVKEVHLQGHTNHLRSLSIRKGLGNPFIVSASLIDSIGEGVFLSVSKEKIQENASKTL